MFVLTLDDGTDSLDAIVCGRAAEDFFFGIPPVNLYTNNQSAILLGKRIGRLLQPAAYIDCCIVSYHLVGSSQHGERSAIYYQIQQTRWQG